jgi:hypothetical protein
MGVPTHATNTEIDNSPPPLANFVEQSSPPPPSPMPSNIPPAPPLPNSTIQSLVIRSSKTSTPTTKTNSDNNTLSPSQRDAVSVTSEASIQDQRPYIMRDLHSDLLEEIKKGKSAPFSFILCFFLVQVFS